MDSAMTRISQLQNRPLCPHLAAAALWMSRDSTKVRRGKGKIGYARIWAPAADDFLAL
jgi:hypothetical protein